MQIRVSLLKHRKNLPRFKQNEAQRRHTKETPQQLNAKKRVMFSSVKALNRFAHNSNAAVLLNEQNIVCHEQLMVWNVRYYKTGKTQSQLVHENGTGKYRGGNFTFGQWDPLPQFSVSNFPVCRSLDSQTNFARTVYNCIFVNVRHNEVPQF